MADIQFRCPNCQNLLTVDASAEGRTVPCPECKQNAFVPRAERAAEKPRVALRPSYGANAQAGQSCPACGKGLPSDAVFCTACGLDLKSGKKRAAPRRAWPRIPWALLVKCVVIAALAWAGYEHREWIKTHAVETYRQFFPPPPPPPPPPARDDAPPEIPAFVDEAEAPPVRPTAGGNTPQSSPQFCAPCNGGGKVRCTACMGRGRVEQQTFKPCTQCKGSGTFVARLSKKTSTCPFCAGKGKIPGTEFVNCGPCAGTGAVTCSSCNGTGRPLPPAQQPRK